MEDPFPNAQRALEGSLRNIQAQLRELDQQIRQAACPCSLTATVNLDKSLSAFEDDLKLLTRTLTVVANQPTKFELSATELAARQSFIENMTLGLSSLKKRKETLINGARRDCRVHSVSTEKSKLFSRTKAEDTFVQHEIQRQESLNRKQDERLAEIAHNASRLAQTAHTINTELESQAVLVDDLADDVANQGGALKGVMTRMGVILKTNSRRQIKQVLYLAASLLLMIFTFVMF